MKLDVQNFRSKIATIQLLCDAIQSVRAQAEESILLSQPGVYLNAFLVHFISLACMRIIRAAAGLNYNNENPARADVRFASDTEHMLL